jgi:hypothetical protein
LYIYILFFNKYLFFKQHIKNYNANNIMSSNNIKLYGIKRIIKYIKKYCDDIPLKSSKYMSIVNGIDIKNAIKCGHLYLVMMYYVNGYSIPTINDQLNVVAELGFLNIFQFIINFTNWDIIRFKSWRNDKENIYKYMESAAKGGHLEIIILLSNKYLSNKSVGFSYHAIIQCAIKYKQEIVALYFFNIGANINNSHINMACLKGCINLLLYFFTKNKLKQHNIKLLVDIGNLDCIKCLHNSKCPLIEYNLLDYAVFKKQMPIIDYLKNSGFCFSHVALNNAICNNDIDMLRYLYNYIPICTPNALCNAINENNMEIIEYLCDHYREHCMTCCMIVAGSSEKKEIIEWFREKFHERHFKELMISLNNENQFKILQSNHLHSHCYVLDSCINYNYYRIRNYFIPPQP